MDNKSKHIFIVTWYKSENFGTCLQAYATYSVLQKNNDVVFLDRRTYYPITKLSFFLNKVIHKLMAKLKNGNSTVSFLGFEYQHRQKIDKIEQFCKNNYEVRSIQSRKDVVQIDTWADCYLVGSDQMWNPWLLSPQYLLDFVPQKSKKPKYSYAASFGVDSIPNEKKHLYQKYLPKFTHITVREPRASELVKNISSKYAEVVLDPTFLLTQNEWSLFASKSNICGEYGLNRDYVVCYFIGAQEFDHIKTVKKLAVLFGLKVVLLPIKENDYLEKDVTIIANACAYDFVSLIDNAKLVCTDSFHAVVFSFLMGTPFYDFPRFNKGDIYSQESRLQNIIEKFGLNNSYWNDDLNTQEIENHMTCDYSQGYEVLENDRKRSLKILYDMIDGKVEGELDEQDC